MQSHMSYSSCSCFVCLTGPYAFVYLVLEQLKVGSLSTINLILTTGCSTWHLMAKHSLRILKLELLLSTKMAEAIWSSVTAWNWVTVQWPGSYRGFPRRDSLVTGLARVDQRSKVLVLCIRCRSWLKKRRMSAASIALEVAEGEGQLVSAQTIPHTHCNKSFWMAVVPEGSLFWSWFTKKPANCLLKTTWRRAWITGTMSCGLMSLISTFLAHIVSSMCGDQCLGKLLLKVMHYNIALLPKKVTNYVT